MRRTHAVRISILLAGGLALVGCDPIGDTPPLFPRLEHEGHEGPSSTHAAGDAHAAAGPTAAPVPASAPASAPGKPAGMLADEFPVPPPPFSEDIFPCEECHEMLDPDPAVRELEEEHDTIEFHHGDRERWCFDCHNPDDRDKLRLASGTLIPFEESYRLCGQCHGDKLRDWRLGVHGRRTGEWNGKREYLLCAHCHNPHWPGRGAGIREDGTPFLGPIPPLPPPRRPEEVGVAL